MTARRLLRPGKVSTCRSCGARIVWTKTEASGGLMPVDAAPAEGGNVLFTGVEASTMDGGTIPVARVEAGPPLFDDGEPRYLSHFATCPDADDWRRP